MKVVVDMNLSPDWINTFSKYEIQAIHWSSVGHPRATDRDIMEWASTNGYIVFTHDLDFGALLAATQAKGPSVIQVRTQDVLPEHLEAIVINAIHQFEKSLETGALVTVDESRSRVKILPFS